MSCVTLMVNRSDRRFQTLSPRMAARGRETDQPNEARGNPSRPGLHLTPDKQAGYMTATEFQIASAIQPLTRAGSIYAWRHPYVERLKEERRRSFDGWQRRESAHQMRCFGDQFVRKARQHVAFEDLELGRIQDPPALGAYRCSRFHQRRARLQQEPESLRFRAESPHSGR